MIAEHMDIDILIAGLRRSGTTMLANMLHVPPHQVSLIEPNLARRGRMRRWRSQLAQADRIVVKEIDGTRITRAVEQFDVGRTIVLVRHVGDAALSIMEWYLDQNRRDMRPQRAISLLIDNARFLQEFSLSHPNALIVRYEDLVEAPNRFIEQAKSWGFESTGELHQRLQGREFELARHGRVVSTASVERRHREPNEERVAIAKQVALKCRTFQVYFGYAIGSEHDKHWLARSFARGWRSGGSETSCGIGSTLEATSSFRSGLREIVERFGIRKINDAGCGDLGWQSKLDLGGVEYNAYDVVTWPAWSDACISIRRHIADFCTTTLPLAEMTICRDAMIHLPNWMIVKALNRFRKASHFLLATSFDGASNSERIESPGGFSRLDLTADPFSLGEPLLKICEPFEKKFVGLWKLAN